MLPSVYDKDSNKTRAKKALKDCEAGVVGAVDDELRDLDSEIVEVKKSKTYDAYNVLAIVDNKIVSWMSKYELKLGNTVIVKAKVKDHAKHWKHDIPVTRLNYVKAA